MRHHESQMSNVPEVFASPRRARAKSGATRAVSLAAVRGLGWGRARGRLHPGTDKQRVAPTLPSQVDAPS